MNDADAADPDAAPPHRPNVLFVICDQLRADHLGFAGNPVVRTPHIDGIAAGGTVFDRAYVNNPVCMPNRSTIMTGRMPSAHGVVFNDRSLEELMVLLAEPTSERQFIMYEAMRKGADVATLHELDHDALVRILTEPKNCLVRQYQTILSFEGVELSFTADALDAVVEQALTRKVGARGLRIILEELMLDVMYQVPSAPDIKELVISQDVVERRVPPLTAVRKVS